jgi:uncharacterized protein (TIGR03067 family)
VPAEKRPEVADAPADEALQGVWEMTKFYTEYTPGTKSYLLLTSRVLMIIDGNELLIESENGEEKKSTKLRLVTDTSRSPKSFRQFNPANPEAKPFVGIYKVEGDVLLIASQDGDTPPDAFDAKKNNTDGRRIEEYIRVRQ